MEKVEEIKEQRSTPTDETLKIELDLLSLDLPE
jgi:hypothetical protein